MSAVPFGLVEDLELERLLAAELELDADRHYRAGRYAYWSQARREAELARARVAELELELAEASA